eukprot:6211466-Pleurochrysis_carterae.AAC.3
MQTHDRTRKYLMYCQRVCTLANGSRVPSRDVHAVWRPTEGAARWRACVLRSVGMRRRHDLE